MGKLAILLFLASFVYCSNKQSREDQKIIDRITYISNLKNAINKKIWHNFSDSQYDVPFVYYADTCCYVANPTTKFIQQFTPTLIYQNSGLKIYQTKLIDSIPFHLETSIIFGDSTNDYNYNSPFMNCSSFEITKKKIPSVKSTEQWATMILHEYFHGFQLKHKPYFNYFGKNIARISSDSLMVIFSKNKWFSESIHKENDLLLAALISKEQSATENFIDSFFVYRNLRRAKTKALYNFEITPYEMMYETSEGTARYIEQQLYQHFRAKKLDDKLAQSDTSYNSYNYYKNYSIEKDPWLYQTTKTKYFYATGLNLVRLLDKLGIEYQSNLFETEGLTLEKKLKENYKQSTK